MPLIGSATDVIGIGTLVLVILCCSGGALCSVYVVFFHFKVGKERLPPLRDFDSPWIIRMILIGFSILWSLGELLRLPWLRDDGGFLHSLQWKTQANLCKLHVVWSVGIMAPGFLLTLLCLVQGSLHVSFSERRNLNCRVFKLLGFFCTPIFILQALLVLTTHNENKEGLGGSIPSFFTQSFEVVLDKANTQRALCTYPLFSILLLGLFSLIFVIYFLTLGIRMLHRVINRKLRMRIYWLVLPVMVLLPLHVLFLGFSAWIKPRKTMHEVLTFLGFLALLLCATSGMSVLVVLPIKDASAAHSFLKKRDHRWQSLSTCSIELFGRSMSAVVSDDGESLSRRSFLGPVSSIGTDIGSLSRDSSSTLHSMPKDLTFGPGGWLVDVP